MPSLKKSLIISRKSPIINRSFAERELHFRASFEIPTPFASNYFALRFRHFLHGSKDAHDALICFFAKRANNYWALFAENELYWSILCIFATLFQAFVRWVFAGRTDFFDHFLHPISSHKYGTYVVWVSATTLLTYVRYICEKKPGLLAAAKASGDTIDSCSMGVHIYLFAHIYLFKRPSSPLPLAPHTRDMCATKQGFLAVAENFRVALDSWSMRVYTFLYNPLPNTPLPSSPCPPYIHHICEAKQRVTLHLYGGLYTSVKMCVAVCCSVLQCGVVWCRVLPCVVVCCRVMQFVAVCCRVLQRVAVCCSVLQCVAV